MPSFPPPPETKRPKAVWEGSFKLFGVVVHCYVLDNGARIVDAADIHTMMAAMSGWNISNRANDNEQMAAFNRWRLGK
jgi:hypothetical protein